MAVDLYPYSQRSGGLMTDADHEDLWAGWADGIFPGQASNAGQVQIISGQWAVYAGKILISGHVLNITATEYGALPTAGASTITSLVVAYIDRTQSPWTYGVQIITGTPGGGRPAISQNDTGLYQVPLRALQTDPGGAVSLLVDERAILAPAGNPNLRAATYTPDNVPATIVGATGQSTSLLRIQQAPGGPYVFAVSQDGHVGLGNVGGASDTISLSTKPARDDAVGLRIAAAGAQTADLFQVLNAAGSTVARIDKDGNLSAANIVLTDWASHTPVVNQGGGATYSSRGGWWRRVAPKTVFVDLKIIVGVAGTTASPNVTISLPTTPDRTIRQAIHGHAESPSAILEGIIAEGGTATNIDAVLMVGNGATRNITGDDLTAGMILTLTGTYREA